MEATAVNRAIVCKFGSHHGNTETSFFPFPSKSQKQASLALISPAWVMCPPWSTGTENAGGGGWDGSPGEIRVLFLEGRVNVG